MCDGDCHKLAEQSLEEENDSIDQRREDERNKRTRLFYEILVGSQRLRPKIQRAYETCKRDLSCGFPWQSIPFFRRRGKQDSEAHRRGLPGLRMKDCEKAMTRSMSQAVGGQPSREASGGQEYL